MIDDWSRRLREFMNGKDYHDKQFIYCMLDSCTSHCQVIVSILSSQVYDKGTSN